MFLVCCYLLSVSYCLVLPSLSFLWCSSLFLMRNIWPSNLALSFLTLLTNSLACLSLSLSSVFLLTNESNDFLFIRIYLGSRVKTESEPVRMWQVEDEEGAAGQIGRGDAAACRCENSG